MTAAVLQEVLLERERQNARWGEQNHPSGASDLLTGVADQARRMCDHAHASGFCSWLLIAREEFFEAFSEVDPVKRRVELVQLAAVVVAAIEAEDRRTKGGGT